MAGRGGARAGAGRKRVSPERPAGALPNKSEASEIIASLDIPDDQWKKKHPDWGKDKSCRCWKCLWRRWVQTERAAAEYLWNRREGKPAQAFFHAADPNFVNNLADFIAAARQRKLSK